MSDALTDQQRQEILEAIFSGQKIQAIKLYREATRLGLKEAKDFVDALEGRLRMEQPESFRASAQSSGCAAAAAAVLVLIVAAVVFAWCR